MARIGLGCLRITDVPGTLRAAVAARVPFLDTARAYPGSEEAIRATVPDGITRVVTKCGMRPGWSPDGRAKSILDDARASVVALGRIPDLLLLHAPDPQIDLATSARALARAQREGLAHAVGLSNVTRGQLEHAASFMKIAAIEVALGPRSDAAARGGVVAWCKQNDAQLLAHSPLGGPAGVGRLRRDGVVRRLAERRRTTPETLMLAYLLALDDAISPLVGARTPAQLQAALAAESLVLEEDELAVLDARFPGLAVLRRPPRPPAGPGTAEIVLLMGIPGAGKSRRADDYVARGWSRLNRDELGGTLKGIAVRLREALARGERRIVLDNTYVSRAVRSDVLRIASAAGARVHCIHVDVTLDDAQINVAHRMLDRHGVLLGGRELLARKDPGLFAPPTLHRMHRDLERPVADEGFASVETVPFVRAPSLPDGAPAFLLPVEHALAHARLFRGRPVLVFGWGARPPALVTRIEAALEGIPFEIALCEHEGGPPTCWCRPPLPGLALAFARRHRIDLGRSTMLASTAVHVAMARALGVAVEPLPG